MVKYFCNCFLALRVIFGNQIYDLCRVLGINYELIKKVAGHDPRIGHSHFNVFQDDYRGYNGSCLRKDTKAFLRFAGSNKIKLPLLKTMDKINEDLLNN